ncbi:MAG: sulfite exporter TauE/SafE family protein [Deltaproteobacteria bacterium]|jgi:sulfite exporter TauE/SafE|nr:sulfite exporter TauE/SafE family protein [Deltaproteobacteria bacterium]
MSSIDTLSLVFLTTGFTVGFGHCIGMCGPIVISMSLNLKTRNTIWPHILYHAGRVTTYTLLGGIMGVTGSFAMVASRIALIQKGVLIFSGVLIIFMGVMMGPWLIKFSCFKNETGIQTFFSRTFGSLVGLKSTLAFFPLGLMLGLLPCGPVYTVLIASARAGMETAGMYQSFMSGMVLMLFFGIGTIPALFFVGRLAGTARFIRGPIIYKLGSFIMMGLGIYFVFKGIRY